MRFRKIITAASAAALACACLAAGGCSTTGSKDVELTPTVPDRALVSSGTLTVGVDSSLAPFGGTSDGKVVGLDVDVAAALATELGLKLEVVDISGENATRQLENGAIDIAMSVSAASATGVNTTVTAIGPYVSNDAALFGKQSSTSGIGSASSSGSLDLNSLSNTKIGAYNNSIAARTAVTYCGSSNLVTFNSLSEAFDALENGEVTYVASDSVAGGYLSMSYDGIELAGLLHDSSDVCIGALTSNTTLTKAVNEALNTINGNGVLLTVLSKWTGQTCAAEILPAESTVGVVDESSATTSDGGAEGDESSDASSTESEGSSSSDSSSGSQDGGESDSESGSSSSGASSSSSSASASGEVSTASE